MAVQDLPVQDLPRSNLYLQEQRKGTLSRFLIQPINNFLNAPVHLFL